MLDNETKRRIDTARDVLVGKVPDPKSQVEQITIALVYKFMDDMDKESVEMGGKPSFFTGEYEKYAWSKIFDPRLGGFEMLGLYTDAITRMSLNPKLPQLFRDIFKNAFLPYRDPETLKLFLKTINEFIYDHSERLGDAFEYLLSVLGSQGEAGQFRTPRHIIDFIVSVIQPKKNETILDPACGTAGFLISAYKHILKENTKKTPGDLLTPDDRKRLLANFRGYDISPDMVRLSLVNLYLHGFVQPQIYEYDTLTSEDRWNEYADVILANPPFMSPKGGIKPHKRFSVQSNRSEVLFVDYMAEHLTPTGRAGIIVPEGIIFQSANAYKQLRKYLVDNEYLWAVVSLPAGIFNPYSGVKTSILLMDKAFAKKTNKILFVKVENDGFGLGAQRRPIEKNDLSDAANVLTDWLKAMRNGKPEAFHSEEKPCSALLVEKATLAENGDYNLTGDRHRQAAVRTHQKWPMVELGEMCEINPRKTEIKDLPETLLVSFVPMEDLNEERMLFEVKKERKLGEVIKSYTYFKDNDVLLARVTPCFENGKSGIAKKLQNGIGFGSSEYFVLRPGSDVLPEYIYYFISEKKFTDNGKIHMTGTGGLQRLSIDYVLNYKIPFPPLEVQREIVAEIEGYQKIIDGARQVVENWKSKIDINPDWPMVELGEMCETTSGGTPLRSKKEYYVNGTISWLKSGEVAQGKIFSTEEKITEEGLKNSSAKLFPVDTVLVAMYGATAGQVGILKIEATTNQAICGILPNKQFIPEFLFMVLQQKTDYLITLGSGGAQPNISQSIIRKLQIPLPPLEIQRKIVVAIESEQKLVDSNKELNRIYEEKIKKVIDRVWEG